MTAAARWAPSKVKTYTVVDGLKGTIRAMLDDAVREDVADHP